MVNGLMTILIYRKIKQLVIAAHPRLCLKIRYTTGFGHVSVIEIGKMMHLRSLKIAKVPNLRFPMYRQIHSGHACSSANGGSQESISGKILLCINAFEKLS